MTEENREPWAVLSRLAEYKTCSPLIPHFPFRDSSDQSKCLSSKSDIFSSSSSPPSSENLLAEIIDSGDCSAGNAGDDVALVKEEDEGEEEKDATQLQLQSTPSLHHLPWTPSSPGCWSPPSPCSVSLGQRLSVPRPHHSAARVTHLQSQLLERFWESGKLRSLRCVLHCSFILKVSFYCIE